jgi:membrane-associated phospholipid phosphatase
MRYKIQKKYIVLICVLIAMLLFASFYDLEISQKCYIGQNPKDNIFGIIFSYIGVIPTFVGWSFLATIILFLSKSVCIRKTRIFLKIIAIFQYVLAFFFLNNSIMFTNNHIINIHWPLAYSIGTLILLFSIYGGYLFSKKSNNKNLLSEAVFISLISIITMFFTMTIKEIMVRPRYAFVLEMNDYNFFINWWENGRALKNSVGESVDSEYFKSFPSGHSSYSMFSVFIFPFLNKFNNTFLKKERVLFFCGIIWWMLTAYSRITIGAHYLSDVCCAGLITMISYLITTFIYFKKNRQI